ncbi:MAG: type II toxin-antitoxin system RelE/ParE family toxin [Verrucomicrobia bacterium]|nr:type II toxin-antitoxin system RelE/ParE family toxin [Verrucomicrobiota bacterium]
MTVKFTTEARSDIFDAADYYEQKEIGLGQRFRDEIAEILITVSSAPFLWRERSGKYRRVNCPVFPYYIAYVVRDESIVIVAIAHGSRKPGFWHDRLG